MTIRYELGNKEDAFAVRTSVFIEEQGFNDEFDSIDDTIALHITAYSGTTCVGCARIFPDETDPDTFIFGRLAVLPSHRLQGLGGKILTFAEEAARKAQAKHLHLHAQCRVMPFYESFGYTAFGPIELDEQVEHIWMKKDI
ncbi:MAG: GNAT family N-acetyltransferase [Raoultibacter sp.]